MSNVLLNPKKHDIISIYQFSKISITLYLGGIWTIGIVVLPLLFHTLDPITASELTSQILNITAYIGIIALIINLIDVIKNHKFALFKTKKFWYIIVMSSILIVNYFAIFPIVYNLRHKLSIIAHQVIASQNNIFDFWHSLSAIFFIINCIIGILYLLEM